MWWAKIVWITYQVYVNPWVEVRRCVNLLPYVYYHPQYWWFNLCFTILYINYWRYFSFAVKIREVKVIRKSNFSKDFEKNVDYLKKVDSNCCLVILYGTTFNLKSLSCIGRWTRCCNRQGCPRALKILESHWIGKTKFQDWKVLENQ